MSRLADFYTGVYGLICGEHPYIRPWHFQWLAVKDLYSDLMRVLPQVSGRVLDVGCGENAYKHWAARISDYVGIDIHRGRGVNVVVTNRGPWPFRDACFDTVLCTQVLEHVPCLEGVLAEIDRVLKVGGQLIVTVPFAYNEHGAPQDYRRLSVHGAGQLFRDPRYEILELKPQGGIGSTLGTLWLNWIDIATNRHKATRFLKGALLPFWILFGALVNAVGFLLDTADGTRAFYSNVLVVAKKRCA